MKKRIIIAVTTVIIIALLLSFLTLLVMPKYADNKEGRLIEEYYGSSFDHDVIFVGDCEVYESFVPSILWEEYGITSYVRGSGQQLVWHSYYLLRETFKYESPKAVVFNVYALRYGTPQSESFNRMTLDGMKWSVDKKDAIFASMTKDEHFIEYLFPLLRYHSRITKLEGEDIRYLFASPEPVTDNGYLMQTSVAPKSLAKDEEMCLYQDMPNSSFEYLEKIRLLCEENGAELILVKSPTNAPKYNWFEEWEEKVVSYAEKKGIAYYNFIPLSEEIGIDWESDTYDYGVHLNVYGAEKLTSYFGEILHRDHNIEDRRSEAGTASIWNTYLDEYRSEKKKAEDNH